VPTPPRRHTQELRAYAPSLPGLTTVFATHSHWDHIGGQRFFRGLNPQPRFYPGSNYQEEIAGEMNGPESIAKHFFGDLTAEFWTAIVSG
jgi:glyoxylase-like metal-dependent hydrolase (beta-lactamase superfamily II)